MKTIFPLLLLSTQIYAAAPFVDVIYGEDNRLDVFESSDALLKEAALSTAALIEPASLKLVGNSYQIKGRTLKDRGTCAKERFANQLTVASCSGFLVAPNIMVTAGHCAKSNAVCPTAKWVFDYRMSGLTTNAISVPKSSVYSCKKILSRTLDPILKQDFAVIELDRSVTDRQPLPFRKTGSISVGDSIAVIGHPVGLPTKISDHANVRSLQKNFFITNLDTYHGNSGSPVLNTSTGVVEGILVRGDNDFVKEASGCQVSKICSADGCRGEDVTNITTVDYLKKL